LGAQDTTGFFLPETDLAGAPRFFMNFIDIGAYEWIWVGLEEKTVTADQVKVYPNPFTDHFTVEVDLKEDGPVLIEVFELTGRKISEVYDYVMNKGIQKSFFEFKNAKPGIYSIRISNNSQILFHKLVKVSR